jgi:uncharacterized protein (DUF58 family)
VRTDLAVGASTRARLLVLTGGAALLAGVAGGVRALVVLAAVMVIPILVARRTRDPAVVTVTCSVPPGPLLEGDPVDVEITVTVDEPVERLAVELPSTPAVLVEPVESTATATGTLSWTAVLTATRWGRVRPPVLRVLTSSRHDLRTGVAELPLPVELVALPRPAVVGPLTASFTGRARTGNHPARTAGEGVEFAGIRPFVPGDAPRRVHWPVSSRRGSLFVTERAAESAVDVVLVVDTFVESGAPGGSTLDVSLRGAAGLARTLLASADRVGLVLLGGILGWLAPATSTRQWYRIAAAGLGVSPYQSYVTPEIDRIPPVALPAGALVVVFTPLLDPRTLTVLADLRRRRFDVIVIDVLPEAPAASGSPADLLGRRLWRLQRTATHRQLATLGCALAPWYAGEPLGVPLSAALRAAGPARNHRVTGSAR